MDESLSWGAHISEVNRKVARDLAAQRRLKPLCPQPVLITIYKSLILQHLDYRSAVWGGIVAGLSNKLEKLQNRAAPIITGADWTKDPLGFFLTLTGRALLTDEPNKSVKTLTFKTVNKQLPEYISERFLHTNTIHRDNLRDSELNLFIPRPNTEALKKSFRYRVYMEQSA